MHAYIHTYRHTEHTYIQHTQTKKYTAQFFNLLKSITSKMDSPLCNTPLSKLGPIIYYCEIPGLPVVGVQYNGFYVNTVPDYFFSKHTGNIS